MFGGNSIGGLGTTLSFGKILTGISKTINIANQVIPLYQQVKPMMANAKGALSILKTINQPAKSSNTPKENTTVTNTIKKEENISFSSLNAPVFFV